MNAKATPVTLENAKKAVGNWIAREARPLNAKIGTHVQRAETVKDTNGNPLYHVVYLAETGTATTGYVIVSPDDLSQPIVVFCAGDRFDSSPKSPLAAMLAIDMPRRLAAAKKASVAPAAPPASATKLMPAAAMAKAKWTSLLAAGPSAMLTTADAISTLSDIRVAPLVQSKWNQATVDNSANGLACYNYYTPGPSGSGAGSPSNYVCGCVATAMAQLMRFHQWPTAGVGSAGYFIEIQDSSFTRNLRGGDSLGGAYSWSSMPLDPLKDGATLAQCQEIGSLTSDAGVSVSMDYDGLNAIGQQTFESGADPMNVATALVSTFGYGNAVAASNFPNDLGSALDGMINPNLDAGDPVLFGIYGTSGGHCIVCDGYGNNSGTEYHHLNLGWAGSDDAWYALPDINTVDGYAFNVVGICIYNVFPSGSGEIVSGRVTGTSGAAVAGAVISASTNGALICTATTGSNGIYALVGVPSASTYTVSAVKSGCAFASQSVAVGTSITNQAQSGNVWGVNFYATGGSGIVPGFTSSTNTLTLGNSGTASLGSALCTVDSVVGASITLSLAGTGNPTSYSATGLPLGLRINSISGAISGTLAQSGNFRATITAYNSAGQGSGTLTFNITDTGGLRNLIPYAPFFWSSPLVVSNSGTNNTGPWYDDSSPLYSTDTLYLGWAVQNVGSLGVSQTFYNAVYVDGIFVASWPLSGLDAGAYCESTGNPIGSLSAGTHILTLSVDYLNQVIETNKNDNNYTKVITILQAPAQAPVVTSPLTATGLVASAFTYQITASNSPAQFNATGLPPGFAVDPVTGIINGTGTASGNYNITLYATNPVGTGTAALVLTIAPSDTWIWTIDNNDPSICSVAYGNNNFVAIDSSGCVYTSADGLTWKEAQTRAGACSGVIYENGEFVEYCANTISVSVDGSNWTCEYSGTDTTGQSAITDVAYGNGIFVAVCNDGFALTSTDGQTWVNRKTGTSSGWWSGIRYGNGVFVAVGAFGAISTSSDGVTWVNGNSGTSNNLSGIGYGNGVFVAVGDYGTILTSTDGVTWINRYSGTIWPFCSVTYVDGVFIAAENFGKILVSIDGVSWASEGWSVGCVAFGNGVFVATGGVGGNGLAYGLATSIPSAINPYTISASVSATGNGSAIGSGTYVGGATVTVTATPNNGYAFVNWTENGNVVSISPNYSFVANAGRVLVANFVAGASWNWTRGQPKLDGLWGGTGITFCNGEFVAVGPGFLSHSADGIHWTYPLDWSPVSFDYDISDYEFFGATYNGGMFAAIGTHISGDSGQNVIYTSTDGNSWQLAFSDSLPDHSNFFDGFSGVAYGNGRFVAVGDTVVTSADGSDWSSGSLQGLEIPSGVAFGNGTFVAVGDGGSIETSTDGLGWTARNPGTAANLNAITYANGMFVAVGSAVSCGVLTTSTDGVTWTGRASGVTPNRLNGVAYGNGYFVAVGNSGTILTSIDGVSWVNLSLGITDNLRAVAYGNGVFVVSMDVGEVLTSPAPGTPPNDSFGNATVIGGTSSIVSGCNVGATKEGHEPDHAGNAGGKSVWWQWTAPATGPCTMSTAGSNFATLLAVYTGTAVSNLAPIASNVEAAPEILTSSVTFSATANQTYQIAVDGYSGALGNIVLRVDEIISGSSVVSGRVTQSDTGAGVDGVTVTFSDGGGTVTTASGGYYSNTVAKGWSGTVTPSFSQAGTFTPSSYSYTVLTDQPGQNFSWSPFYQVTVTAWPSSGGTVFGGGTATGGASYTVAASENPGYRLVNWTEDGMPLGTGTSLTFLVQKNRALVANFAPTSGSDFLYSTGFEASEDYSSASPLVGQNGWVESGNGGNGIQQSSMGAYAFIGGDQAPEAQSGEARLWRALNYTPGTDVVTLSVGVAIQDSTNKKRDTFGWAAYDIAGNLLCAIWFDNSNDTIYYDKNGKLISTGKKFTRGNWEPLVISIDYGKLTWGASYGGATLVANKPVDTTVGPWNLGAFAACWVPANRAAAGNNKMLFNEVTITNKPGTGDQWDPMDDSMAYATMLSAPSSVAKTHGPHSLSDTDPVDIFSVKLKANTQYWFSAMYGDGVQAANLYDETETWQAGNNDPANNGGFSLDFTPTSSGTYYLAMSTTSPSAHYTLRYGIVQRPANDAFARAAAIPAAGGTVAGSNRGATLESGEPIHAGDATEGSSVWWHWTPKKSGTYTIDTTGSNFDTVLAVYTGSQIINLVPVTSNDGGGTSGVRTSNVSFQTSAGTTYHIAISGKADQTGDIVLHVSAE